MMLAKSAVSCLSAARAAGLAMPASTSAAAPSSSERLGAPAFMADGMSKTPLVVPSILLTGQHLAQPGEADAEQQDQAGGDLLVEGGHLQQRHAVGDGAEDQYADQ